MSVEDTLYQALAPLVADRVYRLVARDQPLRPYITFQQVGGLPVNYLESKRPSKSRGRFQVNVWADDLDGAVAIARQAEQVLVESTVLRGFVETGQVSSFEGDTGLFGVRQDFSFVF